MVDFHELNKINNALYGSFYVYPETGEYKNIWDSIKHNDEILLSAIEVIKDKWDNEDILRAIAVADFILINYKDVNIDIYKKLINTIFSNKDIARIVIGSSIYGKRSFLNECFDNEELFLTENQKTFAVEEALDTNVHGHNEFDLKYQILKNKNFTKEEKKELVYKFYDDNTYEEALNNWELNIINNSTINNNSLEITDLYDYSYSDISKIIKNKELINNIWQEIQFCKLMTELRVPCYLQVTNYVKKLSKHQIN